MGTIYSIGPSASMEEASGSYISLPSKPQKIGSSETGSTTLDVADLNQRTVYEIGTQPTFPFIAVTKYTASIAMGCNTTDIKTTDSGEDTGESIVDDTDDTSGGDDTGESLVDEDGDGYASIESGGGDCDDTDASVNPGATEVTENGVDDDCNSATADEAAVDTSKYNGPYVLESETSAIKLSGASAAGYAGYDVDGDFDINADGNNDVIVGATGVSSNKGAAYVVLGPISTSESLSAADYKLTGASRAYAGSRVLGLPDYDGSSDYIAVTEYGTGNAYLVSSDDLANGALASVATYALTPDATIDNADSISYGSNSGSLAIGSPATTYGGDAYIGAVAVFTSAITDDATFSEADVVLLGEEAGDFGGYQTITSDLNGDGLEDLAYSAPLNLGAESSCSITVCAGAVGVETDVASSSGSTVLFDDLDVRVLGDTSDNSLGYAMAEGDLNGDGYGDVIIGAPVFNSSAAGDGDGAVYVVFGATSLSGVSNASATDVVIKGHEEDSSHGLSQVRDVGFAVGSVKIIETDENDTLLLSANAVVSTSKDIMTDGSVYLYYGPLSSGNYDVEDMDDAQFDGNEDDYLGHSIKSAGDMDGDGYSEILIGGGFVDAYYGAAYILPGSAD